MRQMRTLLSITGVLLLSLGSFSCTYNPGCLCATTSSASRFAYVMLEEDTIAAFTINGTSGALTGVAGSPFGGNISPLYGASDPAGKFLYATDQNTGNIVGFSIDQTTGALSAVPGSPVSPSASEATVPIVHPSGNFLYVTHQDSCGDDCQGVISAYKINTDGSLTEIEGSPFDTEQYGTLGIAISPNGNFLYAMNGRNCCRTSNTISAFQVNSVTGALTEITGSPFSVSGTPTFAVINPNGSFLYPIVFSEGNAVIPYSIDATSGALTNTNNFYQLGQNPVSIDVDSIDSFLYVADGGSPAASHPVDGSIYAFRMNGMAGTLSAITGSPFTTTGSNPFQLAVDRSCRFLYVSNNNPGGGTAKAYVLGFAIDPNAGTPTAVAGSPFATPSGGPPQGIVLTPHQGTTGTTP